MMHKQTLVVLHADFPVEPFFFFSFLLSGKKKTKRTYVHRFIVQDTVEEQVAEMAKGLDNPVLEAHVAQQAGHSAAHECALITINDIARLLSGNDLYSHQPLLLEDLEEAEAADKDRDKDQTEENLEVFPSRHNASSAVEYWNGLVAFRGKQQSRMQAHLRLQVALARTKQLQREKQQKASVEASGEASDEDKDRVLLHGKAISRKLAVEIDLLKPCF
eukprot:m.301316 g.301316  ORF g.301316 m.301316 type:complete len:218 (+) comp22994_c1_seq6:5758-6411(+)